MATGGEKVKVAVRVRPLNRREVDLATKCVVEMQDNQTVIHHPSEQSRGKQPKSFAYDHCFWSCNETDPHYASQSEVFSCLGYELLDNAFDGYNACILAYGQTGSGKSYTMMGTSDQEGIIPRICNELFGRIEKHQKASADEAKLFKVEVSYMEIYNEKVRDLLDPKGNKHSLRVREHTLLGPYVDGLSVLAVSSLEQMQELMEEGNKSRTVAATNMNAESSRSHAVFTIRMSQTLVDDMSGATGERASKISLVDLAGSERAEKTGAMGERLREGGSINKSLTTLGLVISALAEQASANMSMSTSMTGSMIAAGGGKQQKKKQQQHFVPYRDSVLTWLLKDSLGGNSKTVMVATISPAADNYEESLSTLRYADRAKRIVNHAVINEDPNAKVNRELRAEVEQLKCQLIERNNVMNMSVNVGGTGGSGEPELRERLVESEKLVAELSRSWEERLKETERVHQDRQSFLEKMGISVQTSGIKVEKEKFYLVNLNADPAMNELLVYYLKERTLVGSPHAPTEADIVLEGLGIAPLHAWLCIEEESEPPPERSLHIEPLEGARTLVNGSMICSKTVLRHGDRLLMGNNHFFRVNCPTTAAAITASGSSSASLSNLAANTSANNNNYSRNQYNPIDYGFAQEEVTNKEMTNDPVAATIAVLEKQHQLDKEAALEKQRRMYEQQIIALKSQCVSPMTPSYDFVAAFGGGGGGGGTRGGGWPAVGGGVGVGAGSTPSTPSTFALSNVQSGYVQWARERDAMFKKSLARLKEDIVKANSMAREANLIASDMSKQTVYGVTLQIPASNLTPKRIRTGAFISEPAILVRRKGKGSQLWSMEKLENKLIDMRDLYAEWKGESSSSSSTAKLAPPAPPIASVTCCAADPFYESQETHTLIGVANVFLEVLFHDVKLDYHVPIISQQGEVAGRLHVEIYRIKTQVGGMDGPEIAEKTTTSKDDDTTTGSTTSSSSSLSLIGAFFGKTITCRVRIKSATGLPPSLSHFVFCQYNFWSSFESAVVPPVFDPNEAKSNTVHKPESLLFRFDHQKDFEVTVTEEFLEYVQEDALSIQVWGHKSSGFTPMLQSAVAAAAAFSVTTTSLMMTNGGGGGGGPPSTCSSSTSTPSTLMVTASNSTSSSSNSSVSGVSVGGGGGAVDQTNLPIGVRTLRERWSEVSRRLLLWVEIHELNELGKYAPVAVTRAPDVGSGGVYHLRQGQQRRIVIDVGTPDQVVSRRAVSGGEDNDRGRCIGSYGSLPIVCQRVIGVSIGCICPRNKNMQKALDSYQDLDLETLRQRWMEALDQRRTYLDNQIQRLINKPDKSEVDVEREQSLIAQWVTLTEERNAVHVPAPDSNLPGAPLEELAPPAGIEKHIPVIFLDLLSDGGGAAASGEAGSGGPSCSSSSTAAAPDLVVPSAGGSAAAGGGNLPLIIGAQSILPKEQSGKMFTLPLFRPDSNDVHQETRLVASWDSSIHEHPALNKTTPAQERVYAILKVVIRLSHPAEIDLHLRKRLCFTVVKPPSFAERLFKRIIGTDALTGTGVYYDLISHVPKSSFDPEARETLALIAARSDSVDAADGESYIERYTRGISEVESILALDRLRQELVIRELLNAGMKSGLKRATSMPLSDRISMMGLPTSRSDNMNLAEQARCSGPGQLESGGTTNDADGGANLYAQYSTKPDDDTILECLITNPDVSRLSKIPPVRPETGLVYLFQYHGKWNGCKGSLAMRSVQLAP